MIEGQSLQYRFYSKEMTDPLGILKISEISENTKVWTAPSEKRRRFENHFEDANKDIVEDYLLEYMDNLPEMGYSEDW